MHKNKGLEKLIKPESMTFLVTLASVGILLTVVGAFLSIEQHIFWVSVFTALGAAILGAAISMLMARVFEPSPMDEIYRLLSLTKNFPLIVDDEKVRPRRKKYHGYLFSHALGENKWKYRVFDFTRDRRPGYLHAKVDVWVPVESNHKEGNALPSGSGGNSISDRARMRSGHQVYLYDGYLCDPYHLILVGQLDPTMGSEPSVIQVFPFALKSQMNMKFGLAFLETPDNELIVTPTILSEEPLTSETEFGPVNDPNEESSLSRLWKKHFLRDFKINVPSDGPKDPADHGQ